MRSPPSLKRNAAANYAAQGYVMAANIVMAPVYLSYMGTEAYGLIGFFTMMTGWFALLDMGLTPTLVRETARYRGGAISADTLRTFLRILESIFGGVSLAGAILMVAFAHLIATRWLNVEHLSLGQVAGSVMLMGLTVPLRWMSGLYRGLVNGFERQVWLGVYNIAIATFRFVGVLGVFIALGATPVHFFTYQLCVAIAELCGLALMSYRLVHRGDSPREPFSWKPLMGNLAFSLTIAFTATVWVILTQTDKLILSKFLPLTTYGVFSIAVVAAAGINSVGGPLGQALLPRLTRMAAEKDDAGVYRLYGHATQAMCVMVAPAVVLLVFFAEPILRAWTGRPEIAVHGAPILRLYAAGNGFLALSALAYYLQYAKGDLRLHFIGNALMLVILIPLFLIGARLYGGVGTGAAWVVMNVLYALGWVAIVHARLFRGQHRRWLLGNVLPIVIPTAAAGWLIFLLVTPPAGRWTTLVFVGAAGIVLFLTAAASSSVTRGYIVAKCGVVKSGS